MALSLGIKWPRLEAERRAPSNDFMNNGKEPPLPHKFTWDGA
jgi:hypothetical protein